MGSFSEGSKVFKVVSQFAHQHISEVITHQKVEDRVDNTVQKSQWPSHSVQEREDGFSAFVALPAVQARSNPDIPHNVVGCEEHGEDHHCHDNQEERLLKGQGSSELSASLL